MRASRAVSALAKEAEVQGNGNAPMRAGTRKRVGKSGRSPSLGGAALPGAAPHSALQQRERGGLGGRAEHRERQQYNSEF